MKIVNPEWFVVAGGDFNCRIGGEDSLPEEILRGSYLTPERSSKDMAKHAETEILMSTLNESGLIILNGRTRGDEIGNFTFLNERAASTIDLCTISVNL
ncbi:unnamed protein product, partial [Allacma fusca]